jgi:hypothetical protein
VGHVWPANFTKTRHHPRPEARPVGSGGPVARGGPPDREAERVLWRVERNLMALIRAVPMAEIEDFPPAMQPHVVGVSRMWVQLFQCLVNVIVHYSKANRPRP